MKNNDKIVQKTAEFIKKKFSGEGSGHDWWHVHRVWKTAQNIALDEKGVDLLVVQLGALLHDVADFKFHDGDEEIGSRKAKEWLSSFDLPHEVVKHVCDIVRNVSFKGAGVADVMKTKEGMIVQDADRLDAIGAVGIARLFAYGGSKNHLLYDPAVGLQKYDSVEAYRKNKSSSFNHFHEKLFLLKDRMHTKTGKRIAQERHEYMQAYVERFLKEWDGE
ncbi:HD domain-containing protein [Candidatus Babeliales bacterium]|nr:HD domain-containing protein [Candidatus Babeliales bacterium]